MGDCWHEMSSGSPCMFVLLFIILSVCISVYLFCCCYSYNTYNLVCDRNSREELCYVKCKVISDFATFRWLNVATSARNVQTFVLDVTFARWLMNDCCGNTEFKHQNKNKTPEDSRGRAALVVSPFLQNLKCICH